MSENPKHFLSDEPCAKCKGRTRYKSTRNCVPCQKANVKRRRRSASVAMDPPIADREALHSMASAAAAELDKFLFEDLL